VAQDAVTVAQFLALSARLLGVRVDTLDAVVASRMLDGFLSVGYGPGLAFLATQPEATGGIVANGVVAAWYSGVYPTSAGDALATYTNAQLWSALDYTKPFGSCGGETGYWAEPPMS
jgi:hypothetical protein